MLITLGLILLILIMVVGGDRGVVSLIALCGNLLILSLAILLMASGVPVLLVTVCDHSCQKCTPCLSISTILIEQRNTGNDNADTNRRQKKARKVQGERKC